eukprot:352213-Chlamydomonas_euryale.AAC.3
MHGSGRPLMTRVVRRQARISGGWGTRMGEKPSAFLRSDGRHLRVISSEPWRDAATSLLAPWKWDDGMDGRRRAQP